MRASCIHDFVLILRQSHHNAALVQIKLFLGLYSVVATACGTAVTYDRHSTIPRSGLHPLSSGLLQRSTHSLG